MDQQDPPGRSWRRHSGEGGSHLLRSLINSLEGVVFIVGAGGEILDTNDRGQAELVGQDVFAYFADAPAWRGPLAEEVSAILREVLRDGGRSRSIKGQIVQDGQVRWIVVRMHPVAGEHRARALVNAIDITAGMRTQERLREATERAESLAAALSAEKELLTTVLSAVPHLVYWKDAELRHLGCNQAYLTFCGLSDEGDVVGHAGPADPGGLGALLADLERTVLGSGEPAVDVKASVRDAAGTPHSLLLSVLPQQHGEVAVVGVAADVTHVSELEQQLAQATRLESIGQLAAGIAHEINTPVQYVSDNTRFVAESMSGLLTAARAAPPSQRQALDLEFLDAEIPAALSQSLEGLERVTQIVRAMKDFSHPGQGRAETDLNRAVQSAAQVGRHEWKYVAQLSLDLDPGVGLVTCYEGELKQAVLNIIVNAAQAIGAQQAEGGREGAGAIQVSTRRERDVVRIVIRDDGPGMDEATRARVFDPFFTTKPVGRGTGQGLSLAHATVVQKHGGTLDVQSTVGAGTTFTISLPQAGAPA